MALLGYARVSSSHQKLTLQVAELKNAGVREDRIFTDMMTGLQTNEKGYSGCLAGLKKMTSSSAPKWTGSAATPLT